MFNPISTDHCTMKRFASVVLLAALVLFSKAKIVDKSIFEEFDICRSELHVTISGIGQHVVESKARKVVQVQVLRRIEFLQAREVSSAVRTR